MIYETVTDKVRERITKCESLCANNRGENNYEIDIHECCDAGHCVLCYQMQDAYREDCPDFVERKQENGN